MEKVFQCDPLETNHNLGITDWKAALTCYSMYAYMVVEAGLTSVHIHVTMPYNSLQTATPPMTNIKVCS